MSVDLDHPDLFAADQTVRQLVNAAGLDGLQADAWQLGYRAGLDDAQEWSRGRAHGNPFLPASEPAPPSLTALDPVAFADATTAAVAQMASRDVDKGYEDQIAAAISAYLARTAATAASPPVVETPPR